MPSILVGPLIPLLLTPTRIYENVEYPNHLLLIILDDLRRANLCVVRVEPDIAKGASLAQEVPALIQFDLDFREPLTIGLGKFPLLVQSLFLCDKALNIIEDWLIPDMILHESIPSRGYDRNGHDFMLRPTETGVNRSSDQHDVPSEQERTLALKRNRQNKSADHVSQFEIPARTVGMRIVATNAALRNSLICIDGLKEGLAVSCPRSEIDPRKWLLNNDRDLLTGKAELFPECFHVGEPISLG